MRIAIQRLILPVFFCGLLAPVIRGDDTSFRVAMAKATRDAANQILPSVVAIEIIGGTGEASGEVEQDAPTSGIIVDKSGHVIASSIVVRKPSASILVVLPDRSRHVAKVVSKDEHRDLVLLKIKTDKELTPADIPESMDLQVGQTTIAVGRYGGDVSPMVSAGILSAVGRLDGIALQTDARVSPALYGGPLVDLSGRFLGVLIPAVAPGGAPDATSWYDSGIAFAIPADVMKRKLDRLIKGDDIRRGLMGIVPKTKDPLQEGTELAAVRSRSPAEKAGLKPGDEIITIAGNDVKRFQQIKQALGNYDAGESIKIRYRRGKKEQNIEIELAAEIPPLQPQRLGLVVREETPDADSDEDQPEGEGNDEDEAKDQGEQATAVVVDAVLEKSPADGKLEPGDVIVRVANTKITDTSSLRRLMVTAEAKKDIKVVFSRDGKENEISLTPVSIEGDVSASIPKAWEEQSEKEWKISPLKLPEESNLAAVVAPKDGDEVQQLGLLVLLLNPGAKKPTEALEAWQNVARKHGVVVCAIAPADDGRWRAKEVDVVTRFTKAVLKKVTVDSAAVVVAAEGALDGNKAEAADSMAMAVAISAGETFRGVAVSHKARPPAIRLKENKADAPLQILIPIKSDTDMPTWGTGLKKAGFPVVFGGATDRSLLLRWTRLLQSL